MIRINLLAEKKATRGRQPAAAAVGAGGGMQNALLAAILLLSLLFVGYRWMSLGRQKRDWEEKNRVADAELVRLAEVRKKGEEYQRQRDQLERKVNLITQLKKNQAVPVHILDQISRNLPDFLWLDSMSESGAHTLSIRGKATNYNAVANFYNNLAASTWFKNVTQGTVQEVPEGVSFSLTCEFVPPKDEAPAPGSQG
jgi:type IV pilus assembly protein PilN